MACNNPLHVDRFDELQSKLESLRTENERLTRSRDGWESDAIREVKNVDYWRDKCDILQSRLSKTLASERAMREKVAVVLSNMLKSDTSGETQSLKKYERDELVRYMKLFHEIIRQLQRIVNPSPAEDAEVESRDGQRESTLIADLSRSLREYVAKIYGKGEPIVFVPCVHSLKTGRLTALRSDLHDGAESESQKEKELMNLAIYSNSGWKNYMDFLDAKNESQKEESPSTEQPTPVSDGGGGLKPRPTDEGLRPCPSCGNKHLTDCSYLPATNCAEHWWWCRECGVSGPKGKNTQAAREGWNAMPRKDGKCKCCGGTLLCENSGGLCEDVVADHKFAERVRNLIGHEALKWWGLSHDERCGKCGDYWKVVTSDAELLTTTMLGPEYKTIPKPADTKIAERVRELIDGHLLAVWASPKLSDMRIKTITSVEELMK